VGPGKECRKHVDAIDSLFGYVEIFDIYRHVALPYQAVSNRNKGSLT
jgi:hypothetical protein